jgi:hypothetical protein
MRNTSATYKRENGTLRSLLRKAQDGCESIDAPFHEPLKVVKPSTRKLLKT